MHGFEAWSVHTNLMYSNLFRYVQNCTFGFRMQLEDMDVKGESYYK